MRMLEKAKTARLLAARQWLIVGIWGKEILTNVLLQLCNVLQKVGGNRTIIFERILNFTFQHVAVPFPFTPMQQMLGVPNLVVGFRRFPKINAF